MRRPRQILGIVLLAMALALASHGAASAEEATRHKVRAGESLSGIALRYGTTIEALMVANNLADADYLREGQVLAIAFPTGAKPGSQGSPSSPLAPAKASNPELLHQVKEGDTLSAIASRYGVPMEKLIAANLLSNPDLLTVGMKLTIPGTSAIQPAAKSRAYTVQPNDTLWGIASKLGTSVDALARTNDLKDANRLWPGQKLAVPLTSAPAPTPSPQQAPSASTKPAAPPPAADSPRAQRIVELARSLVSVPYRWGGASPAGFDCSGMVRYVLSQVGIEVEHDAEAILRAVKEIPPADVKPGDLVFFVDTYRPGLSHVGIYIGGGNFIHAPYPGTKVRIESLENPYYQERLRAIGRP